MVENYQDAMASLDNADGKIFFVYGGGTGKTYLWRAIIAELRSQRKIVIVIASSGIAALLSPGGRTAHSKLRIRIDINEFSSCSISRQADLAELIRAARLIVWDEAPLTTRFAFDAVDQTLRDLFQSLDPIAESKPFGGVTVILGRDFRQMLQVISKGKRHDIVSVTLHKSEMWKD